MKYSVERDSRSGRFASVKITGAGTVVTGGSGPERRSVSNLSLARAKRAANSSLETLEGK